MREEVDEDDNGFIFTRRGRATKKITYAKSDIEDSEDEAHKKNIRRGKGCKARMGKVKIQNKP